MSILIISQTGNISDKIFRYFSDLMEVKIYYFLF